MTTMSTSDYREGESGFSLTNNTPEMPPSRVVRAATLDRDSLSADSRAMTFVASTSGVKRDNLVVDIGGLETGNFEANPVFLWAHDYSGRTLPIGKVTKLRKLKNRLDATVEFDENDEFAQQVERKYRDGYLNAVSIGWTVLEWVRMEDDQDGDFTITRSDLLDISAVPVPGDADALIKRSADLLNADGFPILPDESTAPTEVVEAQTDNLRINDDEPDIVRFVFGDGESITLDDLLAKINRVIEVAEAASEPTGEQPDDDTLASLSAIRDSLTKEHS